MYCEQCQSEFSEARKFCPQCGARLVIPPSPPEEELACPSCGRVTQPGRKFCIYCGSSINEEPKQCPNCNAVVPVEAAFCGECGTAIPPNLIDQATSAKIEEGTFLGSVSTEKLFTGTEGNQNIKEEESFLNWLRNPFLQIAITISLLSLVAIFSYRLGSQHPPEFGDEPLSSPLEPSSPEAPTQTASEDKAELATPTPPEQEDRKVVPEEPSIPQANSKNANVSPITEQPLTPPHLYRVTIPTALRDKPTWTGKEVIQLKAGIKITVIAIVGNWLKVESKSNPPKPPGYVWREDATPAE